MNELDLNKLPRILVVEDNPVIARGLRHQLGKLGYEVCAIASTGEDAIRQAEEHSPDLVLMDIRLDGDMEGTEAAATIRSSLNVPIVFATAHADDAVLEQAKKSEPFGFLVKPHTERELRSTVEMALQKARAEKALIQAKEEWERTFDAVPDLIMILNSDHKIVRANKATAVRLGLTKEEMIGRECYRLFHGTGAPPTWVSPTPNSSTTAKSMLTKSRKNIWEAHSMSPSLPSLTVMVDSEDPSTWPVTLLNVRGTRRNWLS